jgi:phosphoribosylaminoimidazole carboxylase/phosphoribosylaminoimidazole-succinocarboxamide synthase
MSSDSPIAQGKTKAIYRIDGNSTSVRVKSLDSLTAFNAKRKDEIEGKAAIASKTTSNVFRFLNECGEFCFLQL